MEAVGLDAWEPPAPEASLALDRISAALTVWDNKCYSEFVWKPLRN